jgi:alpha-ketoglutarate-dependent 2,4-dichlorophenoxyacetate dioxygenase
MQLDLAARPVLDIRRLSDVAGAEIKGVDLAQPLSDALRDAALDAFAEHHVLVFRNQDLTGDAQFAMTERFGEPENHVFSTANGRKSPKVHVVNNLDASGKPSSRPFTFGSFFWHTDKSYHAVPSFATFLHARELPPDGGDTEFANMYLAYDALDDSTKTAIAPLRAIHSWEANRRNTGNRPATEAEKGERPPVSHPIVRSHPNTGRKSLYIGIHTSHVDGMPEPEGRRLLDALLEHATQRQFVYVHKWRPGDLVMWDNRCLLHRVVGNYDMDRYRRILHRTVVKGTVPQSG